MRTCPCKIKTLVCEADVSRRPRTLALSRLGGPARGLGGPRAVGLYRAESRATEPPAEPAWRLGPWRGHDPSRAFCGAHINTIRRGPSAARCCV